MWKSCVRPYLKSADIEYLRTWFGITYKPCTALFKRHQVKAILVENVQNALLCSRCLMRRVMTELDEIATELWDTEAS